MRHIAWCGLPPIIMRQSSFARLNNRGASVEMERLILQLGLGEYLYEIADGTPMSQTEFARRANPAALRTRAVPADGGWAASGSKVWVPP